MIAPFVVSFILPVILSLALTPLVIRFARKIGATDAPGERKVHTTLMPRIGGLAIFLSTVLSIVAVFMLFPEYRLASQEIGSKTAILTFCFTSLFILGFWDDLKPRSPELKFAVQLVLAATIYYAGFKISNITNPLDMGMLEYGVVDFSLTIIWIVGITNAFNLIDGLDGLASGVATIACISIFIISALSGQIAAAMLSLILAGALVGFLRYNFNPSRIFLGDSGSLMIGFALALLAIESTANITTGFAVIVPVLVLLFPIVDTLISMSRRLIGSYLECNAESKKASILHRLHGMFMPDGAHIHHRLLAMGLSHRNTVLVLYLVSIFFALGALIFTQIETVQYSLTAAVVLGGVLIAGVKKLRYHEIAIFNNGLMMPFYEKWILNRLSFTVLMDIVFIAVSYSLSYTLVQSINPISAELLSYEKMLAGVIVLQLGVFWLSGLYRERINQFGLENHLHATASVAYAAGLAGFIFAVVNVLPFINTGLFLILDFYFLLTTVLGIRIAYQALSFWYNRDKKSGKNALIYGAGENGAMALYKVTHSSKNPVKVIGFLDDDRNLEGKLVYGYPVLGSHWKLAKTHFNHTIDTILICDEFIKLENLKRLKAIAQRNGINVKRMNVSFPNVDPLLTEEVPPAKRLNGTPENGTPVNGIPVNGAPVNGAPVNGAPVNGAPPKTNTTSPSISKD